MVSGSEVSRKRIKCFDAIEHSKENQSAIQRLSVRPRTKGKNQQFNRKHLVWVLRANDND